MSKVANMLNMVKILEDGKIHTIYALIILFIIASSSSFFFIFFS